ncbi:hypothetical protein ACIPLC_36100 [Kitasatospora sp. NPDC086801]|uniref:hypothetical protein n=1 Tax=Kitasatospora sp. NPDC086801 TaxID=3364066 RepID=UPI003817E76C
MTYSEPTEAEQIAFAFDQVHTGLQRLLALATRTADPAAHLAVLRVLWAPHGQGRRSVVQELADVLDTISVSLADTDDDRAERAADLLKVAHDVLEDSVGGDHVERAQQLLAALENTAGTAQAGQWEAVYDSATFTSRLLACCQDEVTARGAAEAWLREHCQDAAGLVWTPDPQMAVGEYDRWLTLTQTDPATGTVCSTDVVVRRRAAQAATGDHDFGDLVAGPGDLV